MKSGDGIMGKPSKFSVPETLDIRAKGIGFRAHRPTEVRPGMWDENAAHWGADLRKPYLSAVIEQVVA